METGSRLVVPKTGVREKWEVTPRGYRVSFREMRMFWKHIVVRVAQPCKYMKNHWLIQFKMELGGFLKDYKKKKISSPMLPQKKKKC
jgi:hypothetical protein